MLAWLQRSEDLIGRLGLFSANEQAEDIATGDLKYLLVAAYIGDLQCNTDEHKPERRKDELENALHSYTR